MSLITYYKKNHGRSVVLNLDVNTSFNAFMDLIYYYYNIAFPLKIVYRSNIEKNNWITKGIHNSCRIISVKWYKKTV
jgi:hypothetical protein